ncbi:hypothetical protein AKJ09_10395 [Labilithrix luteola]|uniref:Uncharacterized protein n=1 Tax=Labilithrix luteola TaxID=1391654 RepID=A0A0K1QDK5_9BACT|nr:hypothetical protein AKJ09_10395 [Labilithrix luteola]
MQREAGNVVHARARSKVEIVDSWSFFRAKSAKQSLAEAAVDSLTVQREIAHLTPEESASLDRQWVKRRV